MEKTDPTVQSNKSDPSETTRTSKQRDDSRNKISPVIIAQPIGALGCITDANSLRGSTDVSINQSSKTKYSFLQNHIADTILPNSNKNPIIKRNGK